MRAKAPSAAVYNALQVGTDSEGGYLVPDEFEHTLIAGHGVLRQAVPL